MGNQDNNDKEPLDPENGSLADFAPLGLIRVRGDDIVALNRFSLALFGKDYKSWQDLTSDYPQLPALQDPQRAMNNEWVSVDGALFLLRLKRASAETIVTLLPLTLVEITDSEISDLREKYEDFLEIFEHCYDGIYVADGDGRTVWLNRGFERAYDISRSQFVGREAKAFEDEGFASPNVTSRVLSTGKHFTTIQKTRNGKAILATGLPLFDSEGHVRKVIVNSRDMTELHLLRSRLTAIERERDLIQSELEDLRRWVEPHSAERYTLLQSETMKDVYAIADRAALYDVPVLITGEQGSGKEVAARYLHAQSGIANEAFLRLDCNNLSADMLTAELDFSFSHNEADAELPEATSSPARTVFLVSIEKASYGVQELLLDKLEQAHSGRLTPRQDSFSGTRIIASSRVNLRDLAVKGEFSERLFFRMSAVTIDIPPLRLRKEDIWPLAKGFCDECNRKYMLDRRISESALSKLMLYNWPGNISELKSVIERLVLLSGEESIDGSIVDLLTPIPGLAELEPNMDFATAVSAYEAKIARAAVEKWGKIGIAARQLGISESTLKRKLRGVI